MVKATSQEILDSANRIKKQEAEDKAAGLLEIQIEKRIKQGKPKPDKKKTKNPGRGGKGNIAKLKDGGDFPDLSGDGKITQKDILIGKGVIKKKAGGLAEATAKLKAKGFKKGGLAGRLAKRGYGKARK
jgi:hypothetical protein